MPELKINGKTYSFEEGATLLETAAAHGIIIPTLCYLKELGALTSCFICVVEIEGRAALVPACSAKAAAGMSVSTDSERVKQARKRALELLLSDHTGDCLGPCQTGCPAHINIPKFIRELKHGDNRAAIRTIKENVALPAVLGRICPEVCEKVCRRKEKDAPVSICHLKRFAADFDMSSAKPFLPGLAGATGKKISIIGAGPAGLTAAYYLRQRGHEVVIYDKNEKPGGTLRYEIAKTRLPDEVLDEEIALIAKLGVKFEQNKSLGAEIFLKELVKNYDAVLIAAGSKKDDLKQLEKEGLHIGENGLVTDKESYETNVTGVFAGPKSTLTVRASEIGRQAAKAIDKYLSGLKPKIEKRPFSVKMGKLSKEELEVFLKDSSDFARFLPDMVDMVFVEENPGEERVPFFAGEVIEESGRCLRCDCRKEASCFLKKYAIEYNAGPEALKGEKRGFTRDIKRIGVVYESGKCIMCGICIKICEKYKEKHGMTYIGRGFNVRVSLPFGRKFDKVLEEAAEECAKSCPTGAISKINYSL